MNEITNTILQLADSLPGYGQDQLIEDVVTRYKDQVYLTQNDIAARLQVTVQTVKNYSADGRLHTTLHMPGGISRYALKDVLEFEQKYYKPRKQ